MSLFQRKNFISHSGKALTWKIDCDFLTDEDIETFAMIISERFASRPFHQVIGIPTGGMRLATALHQYVSPTDDHGTHTLIVDDVMTTCRSMQEEHAKLNDFTLVHGVVIFSRSDWCPDWIAPILQFWRN